MVNARQKGQRGEREVIAEIQKIFGVMWARTPQSGGMDIKSDIRRPFKCKPTICDLFHWEVKFNEHLNIWNACKQAEGDALKDPLNPIPLVVFRRSNSEWRVVIKLDIFLELLLELQTRRLGGTKAARLHSEAKTPESDRLFHHLLSPIGTLPSVEFEKTLESWIEKKETAKQEKLAKTKKREALKKKYGRDSDA